MRKGWTETTLGEIASFYNGKTYKQEELLDSGKYRVLRVGNFFSNGNWYWSNLELEENKYCDKGDLLYAWSASFGPRIWSEEKVIYHYHIWKIVEDSSLINKQFLYYWLDEDVLRMKRDTGNGSIMMHITKGGIEARTIQLPPLAEQKRIVDVVSSVDAYIGALEQQFDSARTARNAVLHDLLSVGSDDWTKTTLGAVVSLRTGKLDVNAGVEDGEFPFFTCARDTYRIDVAAYSGKSVIVAGNGDLNVKYYEGEFNAYQRTYILQAIDELVLDPKFLFQFMDKYLETLRNDTQGSTIQYLKKAQFTEAPIYLPSLAEQKKIVEIVSSMDEVVQSTEQAVIEAKALRSGLLSDLLSGNHEIPASYDSLLGAA